MCYYCLFVLLGWGDGFSMKMVGRSCKSSVWMSAMDCMSSLHISIIDRFFKMIVWCTWMDAKAVVIMQPSPQPIIVACIFIFSCMHSFLTLLLFVFFVPFLSISWIAYWIMRLWFIMGCHRHNSRSFCICPCIHFFPRMYVKIHSITTVFWNYLCFYFI